MELADPNTRFAKLALKLPNGDADLKIMKIDVTQNDVKTFQMPKHPSQNYSFRKPGFWGRLPSAFHCPCASKCIGITFLPFWISGLPDLYFNSVQEKSQRNKIKQKSRKPALFFFFYQKSRPLGVVCSHHGMVNPPKNLPFCTNLYYSFCNRDCS